MRMNFKINGLRRRFGAAASAVLLCGIAASAQPFADPTGTWDCTMSGPRDGLAVIGFEGNSFSIFEILVPKKQIVSTFSEVRSAEGDTRGGPSGTTNLVSTNIFGVEGVSGIWNYDVKGHIIGHFIEATAPVSCVTNLELTTTTVTNSDGSTTSTTTTNISIDCTGAGTNAVSFVGTVVPGKRLTLVCDSTIGKVTYRGIPSATLTNAANSYYASFFQNGLRFGESLTLSPSVIGPNIYDVVGDGPGYSYPDGVAIVSGWKKIAFSMEVEPTNHVTRAVVGSFNSKKLSSRTTGLQEPPGLEQPRVRFNVDVVPVPPPVP